MGLFSFLSCLKSEHKTLLERHPELACLPAKAGFRGSREVMKFIAVAGVVTSHTESLRHGWCPSPTDPFLVGEEHQQGLWTSPSVSLWLFTKHMINQVSAYQRQTGETLRPASDKTTALRPPLFWRSPRWRNSPLHWVVGTLPSLGYNVWNHWNHELQSE